MSDVIIIGAGPAGLSASISCARFGLKVLVIDEFMKPREIVRTVASRAYWRMVERNRRIEATS